MPHISPLIYKCMMYNEFMSDNKSSDKPKVKKLPCGGYAIYGVDSKSKQEVQVGYIGAGLKLEAYLPPNAEIIK